MKWKEYLNKVNEDQNYNPEVFEDEITGEVPETGSADVSTPTPVQAKSEMGNLIEKYFGKGNNDAIKSLDGFANDFVNEVTEYVNNSWVVPDDFVGRDDALAQFKKKVKDITDARVNKIGTAIHDLGVQLQNAKNLAK